MTSEEEQPKEPPLTEQWQSSAQRLTDRLLPRLQHLLDQRLDGLRDQLDAWNRRMAERALPAERRERVRKLNEQKRRKGHLQVVEGDQRRGE